MENPYVTSNVKSLFPSLPSTAEIDARRDSNIRQIVTPYLGSGAVLGYLTEADITKMREEVLSRR